MPTLRLDYYSGNDRYSDGDVEDDILEYIRSCPPDDYASVLERDKRFPVVYHLSLYRQHLLDWYPFRKDATLLEIGGGMGAFTRLFCQRCASVTTVELSKRRAEAIRQRCRDMNNLELFVGDVMSVPTDKKYDYITVLGVLEYQRAYATTPNPELAFLKKLRSFLKPGGTLFVAIENKMGLKYWCGDVEDHCGIPFASINQYAYGGKARTFDRQELKKLLEDGGFDSPAFYYPLPDYKFPRIIYSDQYLPHQGVNSCMIPNYYAGTFHEQYPIVADERSLYPSIARNNVFPFFANSFLAICSMPAEAADIRFVSTTAERNREYMIRTVIKGNAVWKEPVYAAGYPHIAQAYQNIQTLEKRGLAVLRHQTADHALITPYVEDPTLEEVLISLITAGDAERAYELVDSFYAMIKRSSDAVQAANPLLGEDCAEPLLESANCDMIFSNAFWQNGQIVFYDQEWVFPLLPASFVLYRAFKVLYSANEYLNPCIPLQDWLERYHLSALRTQYDALEEKLFSKVQNQTVCGFIGALRALPDKTIENNLSYLTSAAQQISRAEQSSAAYQKGFEQLQVDVETLNSALTQRSKDVETLSNALTQRSRDVETLNNALTQRSRDVETLNNALTQRGRDVETLNNALTQRSRDVETLNNALTQRGRDVETLNNALTERNGEVERLNDALSRSNSASEALKRDNQSLQETIDALSARLNDIEQTFWYKAYRKAKTVLKH